MESTYKPVSKDAVKWHLSVHVWWTLLFMLLHVIIPCVQVVNIHLPVDRETGSRRPFGFVEFDTEAEADRALAATSHSIAGRDVSS